MKDTRREKLEDYPDILIEQAILGELDPKVQTEIEALPGFAELKASRLADNETILAAYNPEKTLEAIRVRALNQPPADRADGPKIVKVPAWGRKVILGAVPVAAVLMVILFVARGNPEIVGWDEGADITRPKGITNASPAPGQNQGPKLEIWRKHDTRAEVLQPGAVVQVRDKLQIAYQAGSSRYGMILSIDGAGKMSLHYPDALASSPDLNPSGTVVLPYAYELDAAPRFERFFFITSKNAFLTSEIWNSLESQLKNNGAWAENGMPVLPEGLQAQGFLLKK